MLRSLLLLGAFLFAFSICAQDWCKKNDPAKLSRSPSTFANKLVSDRFFHSINPNPVDFHNTQIEIATIFSPEHYQNGHWSSYDSRMQAYSVYNSYMLKHGFYKDLELHVCFTNLILSAENEIKEHGRESMNTGLSIGLNYSFYQSKNRKTHVGLYGQITIPKIKAEASTLFSPEIRLLYARSIGKRINFFLNLGGIYGTNMQKACLLYNLSLVRSIGERFEVFTEFYKNYTKTGPARNTSKRYLFGLGFYFHENIYCYSSIEGGWAKEDTINDFRTDLGISIRINR